MGQGRAFRSDGARTAFKATSQAMTQGNRQREGDSEIQRNPNTASPREVTLKATGKGRPERREETKEHHQSGSVSGSRENKGRRGLPTPTGQERFPGQTGR